MLTEFQYSKVRHKLQRIRPLALAMFILILVLFWNFVFVLTENIAPGMTGFIGLLTLPYSIFVLWLSARFALYLNYKKPYRLILFAFLAYIVLTIFTQFLNGVAESFPIVLEVIAQFLLGLWPAVLAVWIFDALINGKSPRSTAKMRPAKDIIEVRDLPRWPFGRILTIASLPILFVSIILATSIPNIGLEIMFYGVFWFVALIGLLFAVGLAFNDYWSGSALIVSAIFVSITWTFLVIVLFGYIKDVYWYGAPDWLLHVLILATLCLAGIYARDHNRLNIYSR